MNAKQIATATGPLPRLGEHWDSEGGIRIGEMLSESDSPNWEIVLPIDDRWKNFGRRKWGKRGELIVGCDHIRDGHANTVAMAEANNDLAQELLEHGMYLPSQAEAYYCFTVARNQFASTWHWTSTQYGPLSAWYLSFANGLTSRNDKDFEFAVRPVRRVIHSSI